MVTQEFQKRKGSENPNHEKININILNFYLKYNINEDLYFII